MQVAADIMEQKAAFHKTMADSIDNRNPVTASDDALVKRLRKERSRIIAAVNLIRERDGSWS